MSTWYLASALCHAAGCVLMALTALKSPADRPLQPPAYPWRSFQRDGMYIEETVRTHKGHKGAGGWLVVVTRGVWKLCNLLSASPCSAKPAPAAGLTAVVCRLMRGHTRRPCLAAVQPILVPTPPPELVGRLPPCRFPLSCAGTTTTTTSRPSSPPQTAQPGRAWTQPSSAPSR